MKEYSLVTFLKEPKKSQSNMDDKPKTKQQSKIKVQPKSLGGMDDIEPKKERQEKGADVQIKMSSIRLVRTSSISSEHK